MAARTVKLTIAYDGTDYSGWQIQPGQRTIQGELTEVISNLVGAEVRVFGASRTDAGVSALGQAGLLQLDSPIPTENLAQAITHKLPQDIAVLEAEEVPEGFDLIGGARSKLYQYLIYTGQTRPVLEIRHCWHLPAKLDVGAMQEATSKLVGKQNFKSFAAATDKRESSVRTIFRCDIIEEGQWLYFEAEGDGFLYNMVRNIVGTLVDVGCGRIAPEQIETIIRAKDRRAAGGIAPPQGLCLMWVKY
ncbi:MAG: tRNA pseudouridine(38-40) synthase TruA [Planctomycetota bacterium]|jgi:tRNA pseudouridine38-40 synthase